MRSGNTTEYGSKHLCKGCKENVGKAIFQRGLTTTCKDRSISEKSANGKYQVTKDFNWLQFEEDFDTIVELEHLLA